MQLAGVNGGRKQNHKKMCVIHNYVCFHESLCLCTYTSWHVGGRKKTNNTAKTTASLAKLS